MKQAEHVPRHRMQLNPVAESRFDVRQVRLDGGRSAVDRRRRAEEAGVDVEQKRRIVIRRAAEHDAVQAWTVS